MPYHLEEGPLSENQLIRRAHLGYSAFLHNDDLVIVGDCIESVSNGDHSRILELLLDDGLDEVISLHVHV